MDTYSYAVEWAALPLLTTIILSFRRDYDAKTTNYRYLKTMYYMAFITSVLTLWGGYYNQPLSSQWSVCCGYVVNTLYFVFLPITAGMYAAYIRFTTHSLFAIEHVKRKLIPFIIPYIVYLTILLTNIHNGYVFSVTQEMGYIRGTFYQLPYPLVALYLLSVMSFVVKNHSTLPQDSVLVISGSMSAAFIILFEIWRNTNVIITGLLSTTCILIIHLYVLNVRKTEDMMTGVRNRNALLHQLEQEIEEKRKFSLYVFSLRGMKQVNEQYGLRVGDKKLYHIADILIQYIPRDTIFRYSGDEFALVLPYVANKKAYFVEQLEQAFQTPVQVEKNILPIHMLSVRVDYPDFGNKVEDLISAADYGIYLLKNRNRNGNRYLYDIAVANEMRAQHTMTNELHGAIQEHRMVVHYQPIYHVPTEAFTHAEALIRMEKQDGTLVYPDEFINIANSTGLVVEMTYQILEQVCRDFRALLTVKPDTSLQAISINVPYLQFVQPDMEERFLAIMEQYNISPSQIKIEITERMVVNDENLMIKKMNLMIEKGFGFELDDFGIDYSNLKMTLTLPTEIIKLDRSLLLSAMDSEEDGRFFKHLLAGINAKGRKTILEGVETPDQLKWGIDCNCEYIQGYYFSRPMAYKQFSEFL